MLLSAQNPLELVAGGQAEHVTVCDENQVPLPPADVTWELPAGITATADDTGFSIAADNTVAVGTPSDTATYNGPGAAGPIAGQLPINIVAGVTALSFISP